MEENNSININPAAQSGTVSQNANNNSNHSPRGDDAASPQLEAAAEDRSSNGGGQQQQHHPIAEFLYQLTKMLTDDNSEIIEWSDGRIKVHHPQRLETEVLHKYFRHSKCES